MLMLCWFYCIPFAKLLYFATGPLLLIFAAFMLRRGIRNARGGLRRAALFMMFLACGKMFLADLHIAKDDLFCGTGMFAFEGSCAREVMLAIDAIGLILMVVSSLLIANAYRLHLHDREFVPLTPEEAHLPFWSRLSMAGVWVMVLWQLAPWVGALTIGSVPEIFLQLPWQVLALINCGLLLYSFWKAESCVWDTSTATKKRTGSHLNKSWNARDSLWLSVFVYLVTLALSYVAHDVLS